AADVWRGHRDFGVELTSSPLNPSPLPASTVNGLPFSDAYSDLFPPVGAYAPSPIPAGLHDSGPDGSVAAARHGQPPIFGPGDELALLASLHDPMTSYAASNTQNTSLFSSALDGNIGSMLGQLGSSASYSSGDPSSMADDANDQSVAGGGRNRRRRGRSSRPTSLSQQHRRNNSDDIMRHTHAFGEPDGQAPSSPSPMLFSTRPHSMVASEMLYPWGGGADGGAGDLALYQSMFDDVDGQCSERFPDLNQRVLGDGINGGLQQDMRLGAIARPDSRSQPPQAPVSRSSSISHRNATELNTNS
ncbi:hypothetical protein THASP1DRAFT_29124, partial [Thamnocephalis sphaerospora]